MKYSIKNATNSFLKQKNLIFIFLFITFLFSPKLPNAIAACKTLEEAISEDFLNYAKDLHQRNPNLYKSDDVEHEQNRLKRRGDKTTSKAVDKLVDWIEALEKTHERGIENEAIKQRLVDYYTDEHVIKADEIPESHFKLQQKIAREQGHGNIEITPEFRRRMIDEIITDQKSTLKEWVDYLLSKDTEQYPFWSKHWAFTNMLKMGMFDVERGVYAKRDKNQVAPFPELNREALAIVLDKLIANKAKKKAEDYNFATLYGNQIHQARLAHIELSNNVKGVWKKYKKGSDHLKLVKGLKEKNTGWCTAAEGTAQAQLSQGDFHVYYTMDKNGNPTIPRVAIRFVGDQISEVRGIEKSQNVDAKIASTDIIKDKLKTFGSKGEKYEKASSDMKQVTAIEKKVNQKQELSQQELRFLYELDKNIEGFGYRKDPRVDEILKTRDIKKDLAFALQVDPSQISLTKDEAMSGNIVYHHGDLRFEELTTADGLIFPKQIGGSLELNKLKTAKGLILPQYISKNLFLNSLTTAEGLILPSYIGEGLILINLETAKGLVLDPLASHSYVNLTRLDTTKDLVIPAQYKGKIYVPNDLSLIGDLEIPEGFKGKISLKENYLDISPQFIKSINGTKEIIPPAKPSFIKRAFLKLRKFFSENDFLISHNIYRIPYLKTKNNNIISEGKNYILKRIKDIHLKQTPFWLEQATGSTSFTPEKRAQKRVYVKNGKLVDSNGTTLNGKNKFVMLDDGSIYASADPSNSTAQLALEQNVAAAGEMILEDGKFIKMNNNDNIYAPPKWINRQLLDRLKQLGAL